MAMTQTAVGMYELAAARAGLADLGLAGWRVSTVRPVARPVVLFDLPKAAEWFEDSVPGVCLLAVYADGAVVSFWGDGDDGKCEVWWEDRHGYTMDFFKADSPAQGVLTAAARWLSGWQARHVEFESRASVDAALTALAFPGRAGDRCSECAATLTVDGVDLCGMCLSWLDDEADGLPF